MKLSDISMGQMDEQEMGTISGLGYIGQGTDPVGQFLKDPKQVRNLTNEDLAGMLKALGSRSDYNSPRRGKFTFDQLKVLASALGAEDRKRKAQSAAAKPVATSTALAPTRIDFAKFDTKDLAELYAASQKGESYSSFNGSFSAEQLKVFKAEIEVEYNKRKGAIQQAEQAVAAPSEGGAPAAAGGYDFAKLFKNPVYWVGVAAVVSVGIYLFMRKRSPAAQMGEVETLALEGAKPKRKRRKRKSKK